MAVASMVLGILSIYTMVIMSNSVFAFILGLVSIILGIVAITNKNKEKNVKGMVITAFILSGIVISFSLIIIIPNIINIFFDTWEIIMKNMYWYY